jgi:hypothetical protein
MEGGLRDLEAKYLRQHPTLVGHRGGPALHISSFPDKSFAGRLSSRLSLHFQRTETLNFQAAWFMGLGDLPGRIRTQFELDRRSRGYLGLIA